MARICIVSDDNAFIALIQDILLFYCQDFNVSNSADHSEIWATIMVMIKTTTLLYLRWSFNWDWESILTNINLDHLNQLIVIGNFEDNFDF